jgi:hypothetical protein
MILPPLAVARQSPFSEQGYRAHPFHELKQGLSNTGQGVGRDGKKRKVLDILQGNCTLMQKVRHRLHG